MAVAMELLRTLILKCLWIFIIIIASQLIPSVLTATADEVLNNHDPVLLGESASVQNYSEKYIQNSIVTIKKCCPRGKVVMLNAQNPSTVMCVNATRAKSGGQAEHTEQVDKSKFESDEWSPYFYKKVSSSKDGTKKFEKIQNQNQSLFQYESKLPECNVSLKILTPNLAARPPERSEIRVETSGKVYTRASGNHKWGVPQKHKREITNFCIDGFLDTSTSASANEGQDNAHALNGKLEFQRSEENQILIYCMNYVKAHEVKTISIAHLVMMIIASIFLFMIVLVHVLVWDKQNIHGWTVATYCLSMFLFLIFKSTSDSFRIIEKQKQNHVEPGSGSGEVVAEAVTLQIGHGPCVVMGIAIHFFYISLFSWMAVINFDMWSTIVLSTKTVSRAKEKKRFYCFMGFGFGIPTLVVLISIFIEFCFGYFDDRVIRPQYGNSKCDLDKSAQLYHEIIASTALFIIGILLSIFTVKFLFDYFAKTKELQQETKHNRRYKLAKLFGKVFFLLAFSWIFDIAGMFWSFLTQKTNRMHIILFDIHNLIQSIGFFWIFVCKKEIKKQLRVKYRIFEDAFAWLDTKFPPEAGDVTIASQSGQH